MQIVIGSESRWKEQEEQETGSCFHSCIAVKPLAKQLSASVTEPSVVSW